MKKKKREEDSYSIIYTVFVVFVICLLYAYLKSLNKFVLSFFSGPVPVLSSTKLEVTQTEIEIAPALMVFTI